MTVINISNYIFGLAMLVLSCHSECDIGSERNMVKIPGFEEQLAMAAGERSRNRNQIYLGPRSHHQWGVRFGRQREEMKSRLEPTSQVQLEDLVIRTVVLMEKHAPKSDEHFQTAMRLLREQYNLNFAMVGDNCNGAYDPDELDAPER